MWVIYYIFIVPCSYLTFCWNREIIETPKPTKKKQVYAIVSCFVYVLVNLILNLIVEVPSPSMIALRSQLRLVKTVLLFRFRVSCLFNFAFFLTHSFHRSSLVLAAIKSVAASGNTPTFDADDTRWDIVLWSASGQSVIWPVFDCSVTADKQIVARPEYVWHLFFIVLSFILSRRTKVKTEKALYADKVGVVSSVK